MLKVGIIGNGGIANCHASGYKALGDRVEIVACCDIVEEKAKAFAEKYDIPNYYTDCKDMLAKEDIDVISVCTWNSAHAPCTIAALDAGCHVICEKPMAMSAAEAEEMKAAAEKNGKLLMVGFVRRQGDDARDAKALVDNGELGEVYYAKATYLRRCGCPGGWFGDKSLSGGGPLIDLGVHVIDLTRYIMGNAKPVTVFGITSDKIGARSHIHTTEWESETKVEKPVFNVEDLAVATIKFDNGASLHVETSFNLNKKENEGNIELFGSKAGLTLDPFELHTEYAGNLADIAIKGKHNFDFHRDFNREIKNFVDAAEGKAECKATAEDGVILMKVIDAVYASAASGKSIEIKY